MTKSFMFTKIQRDSTAGYNGRIKEVNGVNGTPRSIAPGFPDLEDQFNQLGFKHLRFHDNLGFGDLDNYMQATDAESQFAPNIPANLQSKTLKLIADIGNTRTIFPYAAAGMRSNDYDLAFKNANYAMTDQHFREVLNNNPSVNPNNIQREITFRIGRTNRGGHEPPQDFDIYATLVSTLVDRYSLNYQSTGLPRKVAYWEIWNEPDLTIFWNNNNPQLYYDFYAKIAKMVKAVDPTAKVGGAGVANGYNPGGEYLDGLLNYCKTNNVPIDFISWHHYAVNTSDPQNIIDIGNSVKSSLDKYGYGDIESLCTEWNSSPFGNANIYSKVQSAKNAAYIASTLIYMQYTKVDIAHYYRGDASSFGLFNDNGGFCTYAGQAFGLFNKLLETPNILMGQKDFSTGLTVMACDNDEGNKINILAANYVVDKTFSSTSAPTESPLYKQYYVDGNRSLDQLTDSWSLWEWFGNVDPNTIQHDNVVTQKSVVSELPSHGILGIKSRNYIDSNKGISISIHELGSTSCTVKAYRVKEGGQLDTVLPVEVTNQVQHTISDNVLTIIDTGATPSTVTFYSVELNNSVPSTPALPPVPAPTNPGIAYTKELTRTDNTLIDFLPDDFSFTLNKKYVLTIQGIPSSAQIKTAGNYERVLALWNEYVVSVPDKEVTYHYDYGGSNLLEILSSSAVRGNFEVTNQGGYSVTCNLAEL
ncbi:glycoside hydrolase family 39 [Pantoea agglomerans]|uniref:GH39 family glycosyl hydrolase n=1 Tax=Enterobacter agglomerans TaxID=549 RepID=UPI0013C5A5D1|nr:glycoside hydrolase family 39 [Pantoea agglomerans]NEG64482.1 glycoside hydrolase family 39 [Pantoea agglomerans]